MSSSQRPDKKVATSSQRKRVRSRGNVSPAPAVPSGQTKRFGVKVVVKEGKVWWKKHTEERLGFIRGTGMLLVALLPECVVLQVFRKSVDYMAPLFPALVDITRTKGIDTEFRPIPTTNDRHRRDELIMARMYGLEMLRHQNGCLVSTYMQLGDVERRYMLNAHDKALLGIGFVFREPVDDDISTDEDRCILSRM
ncbi:hypothetical protein H5410_022107 [Solanum commersonii]|uniref:Uncharacterized protein n=1 Tax=Solanum commersonii TaxID=4109 RepID=A0A9J5ZDU7_SOLCO|nr:hypothetical protein H5410_022107 [Solanum commersonii]